MLRHARERGFGGQIAAANDADRIAAVQEPGFVRFMVDAEASPATIPRLLQPFARRDLTPERMWSECAGSSMVIEIAILAIASDVIHAVEGNLRGVVGVRQVSWVATAQDNAASPATSS